MEKFYTPYPDGYCGDEDNGQTSAWYVFSALGFYPVCPGSTQYAIGTPLFKNVTIHLPSEKSIRISAPANDRVHFYIDGITLNGKSHQANYFTHDELTAGAEILFQMSDRANTRRGTAPSDRPYSMSNTSSK